MGVGRSLTAGVGGRSPTDPYMRRLAQFTRRSIMDDGAFFAC